MTIRAKIYAALIAVLPNTHFNVLPDNPDFPNAVYSVDTEPEEQWCMGGGYSQHTVQIIALDLDADKLELLVPRFRAALEAIPGYMFEESSGDADYEKNPRAYGRFLTVRFRTRD